VDMEVRKTEEYICCVTKRYRKDKESHKIMKYFIY
jgi:hypothetical protein